MTASFLYSFVVEARQVKSSFVEFWTRSQDKNCPNTIFGKLFVWATALRNPPQRNRDPILRKYNMSRGLKGRNTVFYEPLEYSCWKKMYFVNSEGKLVCL